MTEKRHKFVAEADDFSPGMLPTLDDMLSIVGARGKSPEEQGAALQRGLDTGVLGKLDVEALQRAGLMA
jgi:hypothetical protein